MADLTNRVVKNTRDLGDNFNRRGTTVVTINGQEFTSQAKNEHKFWLTLDNDLEYVSAMKFRFVCGGGGGGGGETNIPTHGTNLYKSFTEFMDKFPPGSVVDMDGAHGAQCPVADTMVLMADGHYKAVQDIRPCEVVAGGNVVVSNNPKEYGTYDITTDLGVIRVTLDHKFIAEDGSEVIAKDLKVGQTLSYDYSKDLALFDLSPDECKFLGYWLAQGYRNYDEEDVLFEVGVSARTPLQRQYLEGLGIRGKWIDYVKGTGKGLHPEYHLFKIGFGRYPNLFAAINKLEDNELPRWFSPEQVMDIADGYFAVNGTPEAELREGEKMRTRSLHKRLLVGLQHALASCGLLGTITKVSDIDERNTLYELSVSEKPLKSVKVLDVKKAGIDTVYVINLTGDHLYYGDNLKHHNCWDYADAFWVGQVNRTLQTRPGGNGNACDCWNISLDANKVGFIVINNWSDLKPGDWAFWNCTNRFPNGHVAMCVSPELEGGLRSFYGQNQGNGNPVANGGQAVSSQKFGPVDFLGALRYAEWA